jgi:putative FmdB family regulatory protein
MIYEYKCECGEVVEVDLPMADEKPETVECPECDEDAHRIFQAPMVRYKGPGFSKSASYTVPPK